MTYLYLTLLLLPALVASVEVTEVASIQIGDDVVPRWYPRFNIEFNETSIILFKRKSNGKWWYDAANGNEVITREDGRGDRYCGSIHPRDPTPCTHLVTNGMRYLIFPEINDCCLCCLDSQGCGVTDPNWLSDYEFQGLEIKNGVPANKFLKKDVTRKYFFTTADDAQIPVQYEEWPTLYQSMHIETFDQGPIDEELLKVPAGCKPRCPLTSLCTAVGHRKLLQGM